MKDEPVKAEPFRFDPKKRVSDLGARLLAASNGLHNHPTDGWPVSEPFTTRHAPQVVRS